MSFQITPQEANITVPRSVPSFPSFGAKPAWSVGDNRAHLPKWYVPAFFVVLVTSLALPAGKARIYTTLPIVLGLCAMLPYHTEGSFKKDFDLGNLVLGWFLVYISLVLTKPETQFWRKDGRTLTPDERMAELESAGYFAKLMWSFNVWTNPRGIGWSHQVGGLRPAAPEGMSVKKFVIRKFAYALGFFVTLDVLHLWYKYLEQTSGDPNWTVFSEPIPIRILIGISNQFRIFCEMASMHSLVAALTTAIGIYKPSDWPPIVGRLQNAYSIRRFWGMVWHQFMRQVAHSTGLLFSRDLFKLPRGSTISRLVYLVGAFAGTGFYHTIVTVYATAFRAGLNPCGDLQFFVLQAVGMFMEGWAIDFVLWSGHGGNKTGWKIFGYMWFASWLGYSCLWYLEELRKAGLWDVDLKVLGYFGFKL